MLNIRLIIAATGFLGFVGLAGCQQQTSNTNVTVNVSSTATVSAYDSGGSVSTSQYAYSYAQPDKIDLDLVMTLEDAAWFESRIGMGAPFKRVTRYVGKIGVKLYSLLFQNWRIIKMIFRGQTGQ